MQAPDPIGFQIDASREPWRPIDISHTAMVAGLRARYPALDNIAVYWLVGKLAKSDMFGRDPNDDGSLYVRAASDADLRKLLERTDMVFEGALRAELRHLTARRPEYLDDDKNLWADESDSAASSVDEDDDDLSSSTSEPAPATVVMGAFVNEEAAERGLNPVWPWDRSSPDYRQFTTFHRYTQRELVAMIDDLSIPESMMDPVKIAGKGMGILAKRDIAQREFVSEYTGDLLLSSRAVDEETGEQYWDTTVIDERKAAHATAGKGIYVIESEWAEKGGRPFAVDPTDPEMCRGNLLARLVNHSRATRNIFLKVLTIGGRPRLGMFALRPISKGKELLFNYGEEDEDILKEAPWLRY